MFALPLAHLLLWAGALWLAGCARQAEVATATANAVDPDPPRLALAPCARPGIAAMESPTTSAQGAGNAPPGNDGPLCGTLEVWENRTAREGRRLRLDVVVVPALDAIAGERSRNALFHLEGGPGIAATQAAGFFAGPEAAAFRQGRDIVLIDLRGTGGTNALRCPEIEGLAADPRTALGEMYPIDAVERCRAALSLRADLRYYRTDQAVADLEEARGALGYERIDLGGLSYGTRLALAYADAYPERVRSLLLTGVVPPGLRIPSLHAVAGQQALDLVFARCAEDPACRARFPDVASDWASLIRALREQPATVAWSPPAGATSDAGDAELILTLSADVFAERVRTLMYSAFGAREIPFLVHHAARGDFKPFLDRVLAPGGGGPDLAEGLYLALTCAEDVPFLDAALRARAAATGFGTYRIDQQVRACSNWPREEGFRPQQSLRPSNIPTLILAGEIDPVTPPQWGTDVLAGFSRGRQITIRDMGHIVDGLENLACFDAIAGQFLREADAENLDTDCLATMRPPAFRLQ
jgi:pimeloyl-ACP methyl ester carboxylesterase